MIRESYTYYVGKFGSSGYGVYRRESEFVSQRVAECARRGDAILVCACLNAHVGVFVDMDDRVVA